MHFPLDRPLYSFNGTEPFTLADACEGVQIFGGIGSGKTSGSGAALARAYLKAGFGGLVLTAKKDVLDEWKAYAAETGREKHLLVFDHSGDFVFPFLHYEMNREGDGAGLTENLVRLFTTIYEAIDRGQSTGGDDPFLATRHAAAFTQCNRFMHDGTGDGIDTAYSGHYFFSPSKH